MARIVVLIVVAALAAAPPAAVAAATEQQEPAQSLLQGASQEAPATQTQTQPAPASTTTTAEDGSISGIQVLMIALAVVALIGGIWVVIARDARRATAGRARSSDAELLGGRGGSATRAARRSRRLSAAEKQRRKRGRAAR